MADVADIVEEMRAGNEIRFSELYKVCERYFGKPRSSRSSHYVFKTPWARDPRVNIQNEKGKAKPYQVRQVLAALDKLADILAAKAVSTKKEGITTEGPRKPPKKR